MHRLGNCSSGIFCFNIVPLLNSKYRRKLERENREREKIYNDIRSSENLLPLRLKVIQIYRVNLDLKLVLILSRFE